MSTVAIYARVSTEEQAMKFGIEAQLDMLRNFAKTNNYEIYKEYVDPGYSGTVDDRPGYQELLEDSLKGKFNCIIIYKIDRLFRSTRQLLNVVYELEQEGIAVNSVTEPFDTGTAMGKFMLQIIASVAELERDMFLERTELGRIKRLKNGLPWGKPPYGYDHNNNKIEINKQEAEVVKKIFELYCEPNSSINKVTKMLNDQNIKTKKGRNWRTDSVHEVLTNSRYIGDFYYNKLNRDGSLKKEEEWIKFDIPKIISKEIFERTQDLLRKRKLHHPGGNRKHNYLLRDYLFCAECGSVMGGTTENYYKNSNGKRYGPYEYQYYRCMGRALAHREHTKEEKKNCKMKQIKAVEVDPIIWNMVEKIITNPQTIIDSLKQQESYKEKDLEKKLKKIERRQAGLKKEKEKVITLFRKNLIDEEELEKQIQEINIEKELQLKEKQEIEDIISQKEKESIVIKTVQELSNIMKNRIKDISIEEKRELLGLLITKVELDLHGYLNIFFSIPALDEHVFGEQHTILRTC